MNRKTINHYRSGLLWELLALCFCIVFGLAHLLNVYTIGDGLWFLYAKFTQSGLRLYTDLHFNLQPLYVLLTSASLHIFGPSWLGYRAFPAIQVVLFSLGLLLVVRFIPWRDSSRAFLMLAAFGLSMMVEYARFDDFHVTTLIFQLYAILLLLWLSRNPTLQRSLLSASLLGVISGLSLTNRLNDGGALVAACMICLFGFATEHRLSACAAFIVSTALVFFGVLHLTGDSMHAWLLNSVILAAKIKSGSGHIWLYPLTLPFKTMWRFAKAPKTLSPFLYLIAVVICSVKLPRIYAKQKDKRGGLYFWLALALAVLAAAFFIKNALMGDVDDTAATASVPVFYALFIFIMYRFVRHLAGEHLKPLWHARELLLLVPMLQLFLAAMTAGKGMVETTSAVALIVLLIPIVSPYQFGPGWRRGLAVGAALLSIASFPYKYLHPYIWHDYVSETMFENRVWYRHPVLGPVYEDTEQKSLMESVCSNIAKEPGSGLLSLPYPHANYVCNILPWHGYVQTWYDTSSESTINTLMSELQTTPPTWIFYERSLANIASHEVVYNNDKPLPHRKLDTLIMNHIRNDQWSVLLERCLGSGDWLLIRTSPPRPGEALAYPVIMTKRINLCSRTWYRP